MPILTNYTGSLELNIPLSSISDEGLGLVYPFGSTDRPFDSTKTTIEMAKANIKALMQTEEGERAMVPEFGIGLRSFCFEPLSDELRAVILDRIVTAITRWLPYIRVSKIEITIVDFEQNIEWHTLELDMAFTLLDDPSLIENITILINP